VIQAPALARLIVRGLPTEALVAQVVVNKHADDSGADCSRHGSASQNFRIFVQDLCRGMVVARNAPACKSQREVNRKPTSAMGHERRFRDLRDESGLPPGSERLRHRSEPTLRGHELP
jgi:hypothetical protein